MNNFQKHPPNIVPLSDNTSLSWEELEANVVKYFRELENCDNGVDEGNTSDLAVVSHDDEMQLFDGYQSGDDDVFYSDSENESEQVKLDRLTRGKPFKELVSGRVEFEINQTHDSVYSLRELIREYAIQEGINVDRIKNDRDRLLYKCKGADCPWRLYASELEDGHTMMIKTYNGTHTCHRVHRSDEAKVKWISSKFEDLVKSNPDVKVGVLAELLRERFNVHVDVQRLYKAKKKALDGLGKDHAECFKLLRKYAYMVGETNPGSMAYIKMQ